MINSIQNALWRVNFDRFTMAFRSEVCLDLVLEKYDDISGNIIRAVFELIQPFLKTTTDEVSS